jgi:uncharacterized protein YkwD
VRGSLATIALSLVLVLVSAAPADAAPHVTRAELSLLGGINLVRAEHGVPALQLSPVLTRTAALHDAQMEQAGYFGHQSPDGTPFWRRILQWYRPEPGRSWMVGENIVWNSEPLSPEQTVALWMASPAHRANLLDPRWHDVGVAMMRVASAPGVYGGGPATIVTADFGVRG